MADRQRQPARELRVVGHAARGVGFGLCSQGVDIARAGILRVLLVGVGGAVRRLGVRPRGEAALEAALGGAGGEAGLQPVEQPGVAVEVVAPDALFGQDGEVGEGEGAALEVGDDGVAHVGDEDGHGGHGDEGPHDEEAAARVGFRG